MRLICWSDVMVAILAAISNAIAKAAITHADGAKIETSALAGGGDRTRIPELFELAEEHRQRTPGRGLGIVRPRDRDRSRSDRAARAGGDLLCCDGCWSRLRSSKKRKPLPIVKQVLGMLPSSQLVVRAIDGGRRFGAQRLLCARTARLRPRCEIKNGLIRERAQAISALLLDLMGPADLPSTASARKRLVLRRGV